MVLPDKTGLSHGEVPDRSVSCQPVTAERGQPARQRILEAAGRLFYRDGYRAVGVDTIVAEAGVAKMSLYRHFPSKDDLIVAYLEDADRRFWDWLDGAVAHLDDPEARLVAMFDAIERLATGPDCLGCTFQGSAAEFPDRDHAGHAAAVAHKRAVRDRFADLARAARLRDPGGLADQLLLLTDGAWVAARMFGPDNPATGLTRAATTLIDAHRQPGTARGAPKLTEAS
jgi:AcrR family transcriptional regulator